MVQTPTKILRVNPNVEVIPNTRNTRKGMKLQSGKQLDKIPRKQMTGDTNAKIIHIGDLNHVQYEGEGKYQEYHINIVHVMHDKRIFFNDETINRNIMHLSSLYEAELQ